MQFFEHQDQARGRTSLLVFLFSGAVLGLGLLTAGATHLVLTFNRPPDEPLSPFHFQWVACAAIATWGVILLGSAYKLTTLRAGGAAVAESLGGSLVAPNTQDDELSRRALNVVEEMAIAANLPVPPLYILRHESGINAFAAGWSIDDAVIGVTQGALQQLNRDQLQGVVAHEFSHILNRDCALNMKLLGVLHGIVVISTIGRVVMSLTSGSRHSSTKREGGAIQIFLIGAAIWLFGSLGVLIARIIQAAVSQQREYLADASAVQFTRNPLGLAGALSIIASKSSALGSPYAADSSHMLISAPGASGFSGFLSSHPPLFERISRVIPNWDGDFASLAGRRKTSADPTPQAQTEDDDPNLEQMAPHLVTAALLLESTDDDLRAAAREPFSARALLALMMLDGDTEHRTPQLAVLRDDPALYREVQRLQDRFWALPHDDYLPLLEICLSTLAALSKQQQITLGALILNLRAHLSDHAYRPYCVASLILRHLKMDRPKTDRKERMLVKTAVETAVGVLARQGHANRAEAQEAFDQGCLSLSARGKTLIFPADTELNVETLDAALVTLKALPASTKRSLLDAAEVVASHDHIIAPAEEELLRVLAVSLDLATKRAAASSLSVAGS